MILNSVDPCTEYLTFGPWIYLVPQFKPRSVLMLGYAGGTAAGLMRLLYGDDFPITAVDVNPPENDPSEFRVDFVQQDAQEFLKTAGQYEVIIVDIWACAHEPPKFVFEKDFVDGVTSKGDYVVVHCSDFSDMSAYSQLPLVRRIDLDYGASFYYYMVNRVARAPFRGRVTDG